MIIVPEIQHIEEIVKTQNFASLPKEKIVIWNSGLSQKEQFSRWFEVRNNEKKIILGTRGAVFLPFQKLDKIIVLQEHDENLKHWDQTPRFHTNDVVKLLSKYYNSQIIFSSFSPSSQSYYHIVKENYKLIGKKLNKEKILFEKTLRLISGQKKKKSQTEVVEKKQKITLIDITEERQRGQFNIISQTIEEKTEEVDGDVFLFINRKGSVTTVRCQNCNHIEVCPETGLPLIYFENTNKLKSVYTKYEKPTPLFCPKCKSSLIKLSGIGTESIKKELMKNKIIAEKFDIVIVEKDKNIEINRIEINKNKIIIGTEAAFKYIDWQKTKLIAFLDIDRQLAIPEFDETEKVWHLIQKVEFKRNNSSDLLIQTTNPEHFIFKSLNEKDRFYRLDLNFRQKTNYPPYKYLIRYFFGHTDYLTTKKSAEAQYKNLTKELTKSKNNIIMSHPLEMHPRFYRRKYWFVIVCKINNETWYNDLIWLNSMFPGNWKVDPNPISLLSP